MKKHFKILTGLIIFLLIAAASCKNSFLSKQNVEGGSISILLPGSGRAADSDQIFTFEISFKNTQTQSEKILTGKTGDKIVYSNARPGEYQIMAQVFNESGRLCYEAKATAIVKAGATTPVTLELLRFLRLWTINDDYSNYIKRYFDEHQDDGIFLEITKYDNAEEYYAQLNEALISNALDAPDIFSVEDPALLRYTQGDMQDYTLPFDSLGITQTQIDDAQFYDYILQMATGTDNKIHGLGYQSTAGAMIYNKAIAEELVRTGAFAGSNETTIEGKLYHLIFPNADSNPYENFENLCYLGDNLEQINTYLVSAYDDIWKMYRAMPNENDMYCRWIDEDNNLVLNPTPDYFYNHFVSPTTYESMIPCHNADPWSDNWFTDMTNDKVFAFFAPAWFINYCLKDSAKVSNDKWGIMQAPVPFTWGGSFLMVNKNLPDLKKGVTQRIIEWMMLDTSNDGLMYKVASEEKDTVTSQVVMEKIIEEGKGTSTTLGGADIFTIYDAAAQSVNAKYKTPYDSTLDDMFMQEIRDHKNFGLPRERTIMRFESQVYNRCGFRGENIHDGEFEVTTDSFMKLKVEPCSQGIKFTLIITSNEETAFILDNNSSYYIRNAEDGIAMFIGDLIVAYQDKINKATEDSPAEIPCVYPVNIKKDTAYCFDFNYYSGQPGYGTDYCIPFLAKAGGGKQYVTYGDYSEAKPTMNNFNINPSTEHSTFDIIPPASFYSAFSFANDVTDKKMDCSIFARFIREDEEVEENLGGKGYTQAGNFASGTIISIDEDAYMFINGTPSPFNFNNCFNNTNESFELDNGNYYWPFNVDVAVNFWIEGFDRCRFRMPPIRSDDYKYMKGTESIQEEGEEYPTDKMVDYIVSPDGTILARYVSGI